jgi:hypothetical protein
VTTATAVTITATCSGVAKTAVLTVNLVKQVNIDIAELIEDCAR